MAPLETQHIQQDIVTNCAGAVGWITLNRPSHINAINDAMRTGIPAALEMFERDPAIKVIVLHGAGPRGFCAGADIKEARKPQSQVDTRRGMIPHMWIETLDRISKPVIAAIHGICLGGGLELALGCDIRIAAPDAKFGLPEVRLGLIPGGGGTQRLPRMIGLGRALDLLLTGDRIDAAEARHIGLVTRLTESAASLDAEAQALAERLCEFPPAALAYVKEAARVGSELDLAAGMRLEKDLFTLLLSTNDRLEAAAAFKEKRAPRFTGN